MFSMLTSCVIWMMKTFPSRMTSCSSYTRSCSHVWMHGMVMFSCGTIVKTFGNTSPWAMWTWCHTCQMAQCHPCHITILPHQNHICMMSSITKAIDVLKRSLMMAHVMCCQLMGACTHTQTYFVHLELCTHDLHTHVMMVAMHWFRLSTWLLSVNILVVSGKVP